MNKRFDRQKVKLTRLIKGKAEGKIQNISEKSGLDNSVNAPAPYNVKKPGGLNCGLEVRKQDPEKNIREH